MVAFWCNIQVLEKLWYCTKGTRTAEGITDELILNKHGVGHTIWHAAVQQGKLELLQKIWDWAKESLTREEVNNLLLAKNYKGETAWQVAVRRRKLEILEKIWEWTEENLTREEMNNELRLATEYRNQAIGNNAEDRATESK